MSPGQLTKLLEVIVTFKLLSFEGLLWYRKAPLDTATDPTGEALVEPRYLVMPELRPATGLALID